MALLVAVAWLLAAAALAALDSRAAPIGELEWERHHEAKLSLGVPNPVELRARNTGARAIRLQVRDSVPALLQPRGEAGDGECGAGSTFSLAYRVHPVQRGRFTLGPIYARVLGPLGLAWRRTRYDVASEVRVYPNLLAIGQFDAFVRRGQLQELGLRNSRRWGTGTEFERLRDYSPDDEYRRINWNATARRRSPVVVDYETERSQNVILALDTGRLMSGKLPLARASQADIFEARPLTRLDHVVNAALMMSYVSQGVGDRVGLMAFSDRVSRFLAPRPGKGQFLAIADALYDLRAEPTEANYAEAVAYLARRVSRRSLVIVFTDIAGAEGGAALVRALGVASRRHLVVVVTLLDPEVRRLATVPIESVDHVYRRAVATVWREERDLVLREVRLLGAQTLDTSADEISTDLINRYLELKARASV